MAHYEVEIKTLLGSTENKNALLAKMKALAPETQMVSKNKQLNHYFEGTDVHRLFDVTKEHLNDAQQAKFETMVERGKNFSVRTRQKDDQVLLVLKASIDEGTSANTVSRLEFEEAVLLSLDELDRKVQEAGFEYQAKWSREREDYAYKEISVCVDRNAGYGYLAEFEKLVDEEAEVPRARTDIVALMRELGVSELPQDRLARMFDFYNKNWREYYGTENVFTVL